MKLDFFASIEAINVFSTNVTQILALYKS